MSAELPAPISEGFTIYTKENCGYCSRVKELLHEESSTIVQCDEFLQTDRESFLKSMDGIQDFSDGFS
jgi:glutaredoxin